jgi:hypothetical protein
MVQLASAARASWIGRRGTATAAANRNTAISLAANLDGMETTLPLFTVGSTR